jgi:hypothetical protein
MSTTPRTGQPRTAAAVRGVAFPAGRGGPEARYMASPASHRINNNLDNENMMCFSPVLSGATRWI